jgi:beta-N-acetylhexosaminidase
VRVDALGEATSLADRKRRAGQRLLVGFEGAAVSDDLRKLVRELRPAGFVLFARNVAEPAQVRELNRELLSLSDPYTPALRCVDQEGGRVQRVRDPATEWPAMRAVGREGVHVAQIASALAAELRAMHFDLDFAPVADVDSNPNNPVIGDRSFGDQPAEVARHVASFVTALQAGGIVACAKHFPGHGDTVQDSHETLPVVEREEPQLREVELPPFRAAVEAGVGTVMTSHVVYPAFDDEQPATLSSRIVPRLLRREMGFEGVVFSDDLEMKAIAGRTSVEDQVERSTVATVDVLLACRDAELQHALFLALVHAQENDPGFHRACEDSARRVALLRERFLLDRPPPPPLSIVGTMEHRVLADLVRERAA